MKSFLIIVISCLGLNFYGQTDSLDVLGEGRILINNKTSFYTTVQQLLKDFNKPDSITTTTFQCGGYFNAENVSVYYYGETTFETHGDTAILRAMNFKDGRFKLYTPKIILDKSTTFAEYKKLFPFSSNDSNDWTNPTDNKTYKLVRMKPNYQYSSDRWVLMFYNGKLVGIEYWIDC